MSEGLTEGFCAMAQWRAGQVLSIYDVMAQAQKQARDLAAGLSVTLTLDFPDMGPLRQNVQSAADAVCSAADSQAAKAAMTGLKTAQDANRVTLQGNKNVVQPAMESAKAAMQAQIKLEMQAPELVSIPKRGAPSGRPPPPNYDFRGSKFDIKQMFAEGFDPDRIAVAFTNDLAALGEKRLQSGLSPLFAVK